MMTDKAAEPFLREYEKNVLDVHHLKLPFWGRDRQTAVYAILAQHDSYAAVELLAPSSRPTMGYAQIMKSAEEGLSQSYRWLHGGAPAIDPVPTSDWATISDAGVYRTFAGTCVDIADMHKMYGRKQVTLEVDETACRVKFSFEKHDLRSIDGYVEAAHRARQSRLPVAAGLLKMRVHLDPSFLPPCMRRLSMPPSERKRRSISAWSGTIANAVQGLGGRPSPYLWHPQTGEAEQLSAPDLLFAQGRKVVAPQAPTLNEYKRYYREREEALLRGGLCPGPPAAGLRSCRTSSCASSATSCKTSRAARSASTSKSPPIPTMSFASLPTSGRLLLWSFLISANSMAPLTIFSPNGSRKSRSGGSSG
jgi:hypothetical protein